MTERQNDTKNVSLINTIFDELSKEQIFQKMLEPCIEYIKNEGKPYYMFLIVLLVAILCTNLYIAYKMFLSK